MKDRLIKWLGGYTYAEMYELDIKQLVADERGMSMTFASRFQPILAELVHGFFVESSNPPNFITVGLNSEEHGTYVLTIRKGTGCTVEEKYNQCCDKLRELGIDPVTFEAVTE